MFQVYNYYKKADSQKGKGFFYDKKVCLKLTTCLISNLFDVLIQIRFLLQKNV